jgi:hypothetical protein
MDSNSSQCIENPEITSKASGPSVNRFMTSTQGGRQSSGFLRLPLELRDIIYSLLLVGGPVNVQYLQFEVDSWTRSIWENPEEFECFPDMEGISLKRKAGILSVSRQISDEALNVLYGCNLFSVLINGGAHEKLLKFGTENISRIRYLRLVAQPMGICYPDTMKINSRLWVPLLTDLNRLCLVTQQPLRGGGYYNAPSLEEDMREWVAWLEPILRYVARNIAKTTIVEIDDNDLVETGELVQKCFSSGYKKVQTVTGDRIFMRGEFEGQFGDYWDGDDDMGMNYADAGMGDDWSD